MAAEKTPVLSIILGDHAGSSPEMAAKVLLARKDDYIPVLVGNKERFEISRKVVEGADKLNLIDWDGKARPEGSENPMDVWFYDVPAGPDIVFSQITVDSGKLQYDSIMASIELEKAGMIDGMLMAPITKAGFHAAGYEFSTEFELFDAAYGVSGCSGVVYTGKYFRSTVVGHVRFRDIADKITTESVLGAANRLLKNMQYFMEKDECHIGIVALNPHAGENGLFGDEEQTILQPAIDQLRAEGYAVEGPWPSDTAINRVKGGQANGIVYLYHDQGNIAQKAAEFGGLMLIYANIPGIIVSVGHGPAYGKAGKGTADAGNMIDSMHTVYLMAKKRLNG
jgi:4-hydroxythreonine-4-phosphate dehydrogenase